MASERRQDEDRRARFAAAADAARRLDADRNARRVDVAAEDAVILFLKGPLLGLGAVLVIVIGVPLVLLVLAMSWVLTGWTWLARQGEVGPHLSQAIAGTRWLTHWLVGVCPHCHREAGS